MNTNKSFVALLVGGEKPRQLMVVASDITAALAAAVGLQRENEEVTQLIATNQEVVIV